MWLNFDDDCPNISLRLFGATNQGDHSPQQA